jgi:diguanylate cyclase (GGDEF)-like protein/putative nucleotidyltransferase with HDIG domain
MRLSGSGSTRGTFDLSDIGKPRSIWAEAWSSPAARRPDDRRAHGYADNQVAAPDDIAMTGTAHEVTAEVEQLRQLVAHQQSLVAALGRAAGFRDPYTAGHQAAVRDLASRIAVELGLAAADVAAIALGASIHDIGKIALPAEILSRPGSLTAAEYEIIKTHCQVGRDILGDTDLPPQVADIVLHHHERLDGSGYPDHLVGDEISLPARIVAVADVLDAMVSHRPYRPGRGLTATLAEIRAGSGTRYDPDVAAAALRVAPADKRPLDAATDGRQRDELAVLRDDRAALRNELAMLRNQTAESRAANGAVRDEAGAARDGAQARRDAAGAANSDARAAGDEAAEQRDREAEDRDRAAGRAEGSGNTGTVADAIDRAETARSEAADDRRQSAQDRRLGASGRAHADHNRARSLDDREASADDRVQNEIDRDGSSADRRASTGERVLAGLDRDWSSADRGAAATDRDDASLDGLTGVYLRGPGLLELGRDISRSRRMNLPLTLAFVDVDQMKAVNDGGGHAAGDRLLRAVAHTLQQKLRDYDVIVRYGGDEFVCGLSGLDLAGAQARLADVNAALTAAPEHGSVTVGIAQLAVGDSLDSLIGRADAALYRQRRRARQPVLSPLAHRNRPADRSTWRFADLAGQA